MNGFNNNNYGEIYIGTTGSNYGLKTESTSGNGGIVAFGTQLAANTYYVFSTWQDATKSYAMWNYNTVDRIATTNNYVALTAPDIRFGWGTRSVSTAGVVNTIWADLRLVPPSSTMPTVIYGAIACYPLTLTYGSGGASAAASPSNSVGCSSGSYTAGQSITLTATTNSGYGFNGWTGTSSSGSNPWAFTMPSSLASEQANFAALWTSQSNSLSQGSEDLSCVAYNNYLYCMGGTTNPSSYSGSLNTVQYASVLGGGSASTWHTANSLSYAAYGLRCVTSGGYIYCMDGSVSGYGADGQLDVIQYAKLQSDGSVSSWSTSANSLGYSMGLDDDSCTTSGSNIYCMGGYGYSGVITSQVEYGTALGATGTSAWSSTNSLAVGVYDHSCIVSSGYIYCMGGYMNGPPPYYSPIATGYVQYASILNGGITSAWSQSANQLTANAVGLSCVASASRIYCTGGANSGLTVQYASILGGGVTSAWQTSNQLAVGEDLHSCATSGSYTYCMGGDQNSHSTAVQSAPIP